MKKEINYRSLKELLSAIIICFLIWVGYSKSKENLKLEFENQKLIQQHNDLNNKYYGLLIQDNLISAKIFITNKDYKYAERSIKVAQLFLNHHYQNSYLKDSVNREINLIRAQLLYQVKWNK